MSLSQDFLEKFLLLLLTASLSGFLIPYVLKQVDARKLREQNIEEERKFREKRVFEAYIARQTKIIEAQSQLLENLAKELWEFELLAISVSYYKSHNKEEKYKTAWQEYDDKAWTYFGTIRSQISKASYLSSSETHRALINLYKNILIKLDSDLVHLVENDADILEWKKHHNSVQQSIGETTDQVLDLLANELRLSQEVIDK
ncbi:MAG: hypothetical protein QNJ36_22025 [Calothrix sp. MO_167.B42]|nr:hypothetical protein [Calothrix sp. MO_167.B42]